MDGISFTVHPWLRPVVRRPASSTTSSPVLLLNVHREVLLLPLDMPQALQLTTARRSHRPRPAPVPLPGMTMLATGKGGHAQALCISGSLRSTVNATELKPDEASNSSYPRQAVARAQLCEAKSKQCPAKLRTAKPHRRATTTRSITRADRDPDPSTIHPSHGRRPTAISQPRTPCH